MISIYPEFTKLTIDHKNPVNKFTGFFAPYSDFNFTSIFAWNTDDSAELSMLNGNMVLRMPDYLDGSIVYSLLGTNKIDETLEELLTITDKLNMVPEIVIEHVFQKTKFRILEERDNFDYIYDLEHLTKLEGSKFKQKRNKSNVFVKDHNDLELEIRTIHELDDEHKELLKKVDMEWAHQNTREQGDIVAERKAIARLLDNYEDLKPVITEILVNGEVKAFSINEIIDHEYTICHFEKALSVHHEHINTFLVIEVAKQLEATGRRWMNWEQDLGLEGLRRSKLSYHPVNMLKKYTVSTRQS